MRDGILGIQSRPPVWKRLRILDHSGQYHADAKARRVHQDDEDYVPVQDRRLGLARAIWGPGCV